MSEQSKEISFLEELKALIEKYDVVIDGSGTASNGEYVPTPELLFTLGDGAEIKLERVDDYDIVYLIEEAIAQRKQEEEL